MLTIITAPASTVISTATAKTWLRQDLTHDDALIASLLRPAELAYEYVTGRALASATYEDTTDTGFIGRWAFPRQPYISLTSVSVYSVEAATTTAMDTDLYRIIETPGGVVLEIDELDVDEYARVRWVAGQTTVDVICTAWLKHWIAREYAFRGDDTQGREPGADAAADRLLQVHSRGGLL